MMLKFQRNQVAIQDDQTKDNDDRSGTVTDEKGLVARVSDVGGEDPTVDFARPVKLSELKELVGVTK